VEAALIVLDQIETRLERNAPERGADGLTANLKGIARQADTAHRAGAGELHRSRGAAVVQNAACATGSVEAPECEHLAGDEFAGFIGIHGLPGYRGRGHRSGGRNC
jgi:hypothetical protein